MTQFESEVNSFPPEDLVSIDDAAKQAGVSRSTMFRLVKAGQLATFRRAGDRKTYVSRAQLVKATGFRPSS